MTPVNTSADSTEIAALLEHFREATQETSDVDQIAALLARFREALASMPALPPPPVPEPLAAVVASQLLGAFAVAHRNAREKSAAAPPATNVWRHVGIGRREVKHCAVLAWLLDPDGDHCQGTRFWRCLEAVVTTSTLPSLEPAEEPRVRTEQWADDTNRVDIEIVGRHFALVIEAKIDAPANCEQLESYWTLVQRLHPDKTPCGLFLTPSGETPVGDHGFKGLRWGAIAEALRLFADETSDAAARDPVTRALAAQYREYLINMLKEGGYGQRAK